MEAKKKNGTYDWNPIFFERLIGGLLVVMGIFICSFPLIELLKHSVYSLWGVTTNAAIIESSPTKICLGCELVQYFYSYRVNSVDYLNEASRNIPYNELQRFSTNNELTITYLSFAPTEHIVGIAWHHLQSNLIILVFGFICLTVGWALTRGIVVINRRKIKLSEPK